MGFETHKFGYDDIFAQNVVNLGTPVLPENILTRTHKQNKYK